jgi:type II secretory pathway component PulK
MRNQRRETGAIVVTILMLMIFFTTMLLGLVTVAEANLSRARGRIMLLQAQYAAESGADAAIATLNSGNTTYTGTVSDTSVLSTGGYKATYAVTVANGATS